MKQLRLCADYWTRKYNIKTRPNAGPGFWLMFLLPACLILSSTKHSILATRTYKLSTIISVGYICASLIFLRKSPKSTYWLCTAGTLITVLFKISFQRGWLLSMWSGFFATVLYDRLYEWVLKKLPNCFTFGEAAIFTQSYMFLFYFASINIGESFSRPPIGAMQISTLIIQVGLIGVTAVMYLSYIFSLNTPVKFYTILGFVVFFGILGPLHLLLRTSPLLWILDLIIQDFYTSKIIVYWLFCSTIAVLVVTWKIRKATKASTAIRKIFHLLAVAVFIPGLLYNCCFLYLSSGVVLGLFFALELLRILHMPPLGQHLQDGLFVWSDEKDTGIIALTPIYLLAGCSLPLWIHPSPCDVSNSALFTLLPLLSGVLTIGIGDTAASVVGSKFGTHKWKNSKKSIEGTVAMVLSQALLLYSLHFLGFLKLSQVEWIKTAFAVGITSIIEARTDQVDNLTLPFVMYLILI